MDNNSDPGDLVVTGIHRPLRWQSDSHLDRDRSNRLDIQPGLWPPGLGLRKHQTRTIEIPHKVSGWFYFAQNETASAPEEVMKVVQETGGK